MADRVTELAAIGTVVIVGVAFAVSWQSMRGSAGQMADAYYVALDSGTLLVASRDAVPPVATPGGARGCGCRCASNWTERESQRGQWITEQALLEQCDQPPSICRP